MAQKKIRDFVNVKNYLTLDQTSQQIMLPRRQQSDLEQSIYLDQDKEPSRISFIKDPKLNYNFTKETSLLEA